MGDAPRLGVSLEELRGGRGAGAWRAVWRLTNEGRDALTVRQAWHPHGRFRSRRRTLSLRIPPRSSRVLELPARTDVAAGETVENAFLILLVTGRRRRWRVLARFTVRGTRGAAPALALGTVDAHPSAD